MAKLITCIYCLKIAPADPNGEHVILHGLKGTETIVHVCTDCNGRLSKIDLEFLQDSHIALIRMSVPGTRGRLKLTQFFFSEKLNAWMDAVVKTEAIRLKPQVCVYEGRLVGRSSDEEGQRAIERFLKAFAAGGLRELIKLDIKEVKEYSTTRLVIDVGRKEDKYYLRAMTKEMAELFLNYLTAEAAELLTRSQQGKLEKISWKLPADSKIRISPYLDIINRCAAKMAFNFACYQLGPEFVLRKDFNPVREYIIGTGVREPKIVVGADGEEGFTWDDRFVNFKPSPTMTVPGLPSNLRDGHFIGLGTAPTSDGPSLVASVSVYRCIQFAVNLGPLPLDIPLQQLKALLPAVIVTPIEGGGDEVLDPVNTPDWLMARAPVLPLIATRPSSPAPAVPPASGGESSVPPR